jgi:hypothetical protein
MKTQIKAREDDFKVAMQVSEREIMQSFAFKRDLKYGAEMTHSLGETITLVGDHIVLAYNTEIEGGNDVKESKQLLRSIAPDFSQDDTFMKDV